MWINSTNQEHFWLAEENRVVSGPGKNQGLQTRVGTPLGRQYFIKE